MLSKQEKNEMKQDGFSASRRKNFAGGKRKLSGVSGSLTDYIQFLNSLQKVFPYEISKKKTLTARNLL